MTDRAAPVVTRAWPQRSSVARAGRAAMVGPGRGVGGSLAPVTGGFPSVTGLYARFRADLGVTKDGSNLVANWADLSGNGHDIAEATNKPLWEASKINGVPALLFDGVNDGLASGVIALTQPYTILLLYKEIVHAQCWPFSMGGGCGIFMSSSSPTQIAVAGFPGAGVTVGTTNYALLTGVADGASSTLALNDGVPQTDPTNLSGTATEIRLGAGFTSFGNISAAELVLLSGAVSAPDRAALLAYFKTTYGLW